MRKFMAEQMVLAMGEFLTDRKAAFDAAMEHLKDVDYIAWNTEDVLDQAEQDGRSISEEDARELLHKIVRKHDAGVGISWDTISEYLSDFPKAEQKENE